MSEFNGRNPGDYNATNDMAHALFDQAGEVLLRRNDAFVVVDEDVLIEADEDYLESVEFHANVHAAQSHVEDLTKLACVSWVMKQRQLQAGYVSSSDVPRLQMSAFGRIASESPLRTDERVKLTRTHVALADGSAMRQLELEQRDADVVMRHTIIIGIDDCAHIGRRLAPVHDSLPMRLQMYFDFDNMKDDFGRLLGGAYDEQRIDFMIDGMVATCNVPEAEQALEELRDRAKNAFRGRTLGNQLGLNGPRGVSANELHELTELLNKL